VTADGAIGQRTIAAANKAEPAATIRGLCTKRLKFLQGLDTWPTFGKGWKKRVLAVEQEALAIAAATAVVPPPPDIEPIEPKPSFWARLLALFFRPAKEA
jgi:lysozyme family protein